MSLQLSYRESQFSPSEAANITGLSLTLQRDWRSRGFIRARTGGRASFSPRELAELRLMVQLRGLGLSLPDARKAADEAAPSILLIALAEHSRCLAVDTDDERGARYWKAVSGGDNWEYLRVLADLPTDTVHHFCLLHGGAYELLVSIDNDVLDDRVESSGLVNLWAIAAAIVERSPKPLFTLAVPSRFD